MDMLMRVGGVLLAPLVTLLVFAIQEGRRHARLTRRAKAAGELVELTPPDHPLYDELASHYEQALHDYLDMYRPRRLQRRGRYSYFLWFVVSNAFAGAWGTLNVWMYALAPRDRPVWAYKLLGFKEAKPGWMLPVMVVFVVTSCVVMALLLRAIYLARQEDRYGK